MSILQYFKKQRECLGHFQSPARMKALLPLLDSAIYFYTRDNHGLQPLLDTAMPHADINDFPNTCTYAVACKNTNTSSCTLIITMFALESTWCLYSPNFFPSMLCNDSIRQIFLPPKFFIVQYCICIKAIAQQHFRGEQNSQ